MDEYPYTTPSGHVYETPTSYEGLRSLFGTHLYATVEDWDADERPPNPTWEMVALALDRVGELAELCAWVNDQLYPAALVAAARAGADRTSDPIPPHLAAAARQVWGESVWIETEVGPTDEEVTASDG